MFQDAYAENEVNRVGVNCQYYRMSSAIESVRDPKATHTIL
jgi:hypothetical protein